MIVVIILLKITNKLVLLIISFRTHTCIYSTRSPIDGRRLMSNDALLLLFKLFRLLLLLPSDKMVLVSFDSQFCPFSFCSKSSFVSWRWMCGIPFSRPWAGAASWTIRRKNWDAHSHGNILFFRNQTIQLNNMRLYLTMFSTHHLTQSINCK